MYDQKPPCAWEIYVLHVFLKLFCSIHDCSQTLQLNGWILTWTLSAWYFNSWLCIEQDNLKKHITKVHSWKHIKWCIVSWTDQDKIFKAPWGKHIYEMGCIDEDMIWPKASKTRKGKEIFPSHPMPWLLVRMILLKLREFVWGMVWVCVISISPRCDEVCGNYGPTNLWIFAMVDRQWGSLLGEFCSNFGTL